MSVDVDSIKTLLRDNFKVSGKVSVDPDTGLVSTTGNVELLKHHVDRLPVSFDKVGGWFICTGNKLKSLIGAPRHVVGQFDCFDNSLTSLAGAPQFVGHDFNCSVNNLTSLVGAPQIINGGFYCNTNHLTSLEGGPQQVGGAFQCTGNQLTSLVGMPQNIGRGLFCGRNPLRSIADIRGRTVYRFSINYQPSLPLLSLFTVKGLVDITITDDDNQLARQLEVILNRHLDTAQSSPNKAIMAAQRELVAAGLAGNAKL